MGLCVLSAYQRYLVPGYGLAGGQKAQCVKDTENAGAGRFLKKDIGVQLSNAASECPMSFVFFLSDGDLIFKVFHTSGCSGESAPLL